jgi:hypothetical protein
LRLGLITALRGERYEPRGECPKCGRKLTAVEIISGFNDDPNDFTTCCSACHCRFQPTLISFGQGSQIELPFFCDAQTLKQLRGKEELTPELFARREPAIFRACIMHHGSLRNAFQKIGIVYPHEEIPDWKKKVISFLGRMPDVMIAECVDVKVAVIQKMRAKLRIPPYSRKKALEEAIEE